MVTKANLCYLALFTEEVYQPRGQELIIIVLNNKEREGKENFKTFTWEHLRLHLVTHCHPTNILIRFRGVLLAYCF